MSEENETIGGLIDHRINYLIDQLPVNRICKVLNVYDNGYVDIQTDNGEILEYIPSNKANGDNGVLIFLNGDINAPYCIIENGD